MRNRNTDSEGLSFKDNIKEKVWQKANKIEEIESLFNFLAPPPL